MKRNEIIFAIICIYVLIFLYSESGLGGRWSRSGCTREWKKWKDPPALSNYEVPHLRDDEIVTNMFGQLYHCQTDLSVHISTQLSIAQHDVWHHACGPDGRPLEAPYFYRLKKAIADEDDKYLPIVTLSKVGFNTGETLKSL
jgi:hypothetical protein